MKSILDSSTRQEILDRVNSLSPQTKALWGKMDAYQMLKHCTLCDEMFLGKLNLKRVFIGRIIGPPLLKKILRDDKPFHKNSPTAPVLNTTKDHGDWLQQVTAWKNGFEQFALYNRTDFIHPFFGRMTREQVGLFAYKHIDHHLRQFGV